MIILKELKLGKKIKMEDNIVNYLKVAAQELVEEEKLFKKYVDPNKNVIDVGGCLGVMAICLSQLTNKYVYVYEPNPVSFDILKTNLENNNINNVIAHNYGIGDTLTETKIIYSHPQNIGQTMLAVNKDQIKKSNGIKVDLFKLDDISVKNIGFIKIDVEGYELEVLRSGEKLFSNNDLILCIEYHGFNINGKEVTTQSEVVEIMESYGYSVIDEKGNKLIFKK